MPLWQCATGTGAVAAGGGRFRAKVWSHWILLLSQAHIQDRYPAAAGGKDIWKNTDQCKLPSGHLAAHTAHRAPPMGIGWAPILGAPWGPLGFLGPLKKGFGAV